MPGSVPEETVVDPVERERRELFGGRGPGAGGRDVGDDISPGSKVRWGFGSKLAVALSLGLLAAYLILWVGTVRQQGGPEGYVRITDFVSTLTGARIIRDGDGALLYDLPTQRNAQNRVREPYLPPLDTDILPYNHLPFEALLVSLLVDMPYPLAFGLWTLVAGMAIGAALGLMDGVLPLPRPAGWVLSLAACSYYPLVRGLMLGQNSALVLLGLCGLYVALRKGSERWAGAALLLVALKPQALPVVGLLLLVERRWKTLAIFAGLLTALSLAAMTVLGPGWPLQYAGLLLGVAGWDNPEAINPAIMHNWRGFTTNLFGSWAQALVSPLFILLTIISIAAALWAWTRPTPTTHNSQLITHNSRSDLGWALAGIVSVLVSLHLNPHDLTLLIFPAWILSAYAITGRFGERLSTLWLALLWIGYAIAALVLGAPMVMVVPSVLLMAVGAGLLIKQLDGVVSRHIAALPGR